MLAAGVQAATRPRAGLSPPDRFPVTTGSDANLLSPEQSGQRALPKEGRHVCRYY